MSIYVCTYMYVCVCVYVHIYQSVWLWMFVVRLNDNAREREREREIDLPLQATIKPIILPTTVEVHRGEKLLLQKLLPVRHPWVSDSSLMRVED